MENKFTHNWHYQLLQADNSFSLYFNDSLIAFMQQPSFRRWPMHATINEKNYSFSRRSLMHHSIHINDAMTGQEVATIKMPLLSSIFSTAKFVFSSGEEFTWYSNNFFSLHWKWKQHKKTIVDAMDNVAKQKNKGTLAVGEYKSGTDLLIVSGFFLSILKWSKFSMGTRGLKRRRIQWTKK